MKLEPAVIEGLAAIAQRAAEKGERVTVKMPRDASRAPVVLVLTEDEITAELLPQLPHMVLSATEAQALDAAGFTEDEVPEPNAVTLGSIEYRRMLEESLTVHQAAKKLHVTPGRVRQRLAAGTLFGIKDRSTWRIPSFQLHRGEVIRGLDAVLPAIRSDAHPLAVQSWLTSPHADLLDDDEKPIAPLAWLAMGGATDRVTELAAEV